MTLTPTTDSRTGLRGLPTLLTVLLALAAALWLAASPAQAASDANAELRELRLQREEARQAADVQSQRQLGKAGTGRRVARPAEVLVALPGTRRLPL